MDVIEEENLDVYNRKYGNNYDNITYKNAPNCCSFSQILLELMACSTIFFRL